MSNPEPTSGEELTRSDWTLMRDLVPFLRRDAWLYGLALVFAPVSASMVIAQPWLLRRAIDDTISTGDSAGLLGAALLYLGSVAVGFVMEALYTLSISTGAMRSITRIRETVYAHTLGLDAAFFDGQPTGKLLTRATSDVEALGETLTAGAFTLVLDVLLVLGIASAMFAMDARLTVTLLFVAPPLVLFIDCVRRVMRRLYQEVRNHLSTLHAFMAERFMGVEIVQLYSDEQRTLARFDEKNNAYRNATIRTNFWDALLYAVIDGTSAVCMALMLWYGSGGMLEGVVTAGLLAAFIDYVSKLFRPIQEFAQKVATLQRASTALEKIFGLLDVRAMIRGDLLPDTPMAGRLSLEDVSFAYDGRNDVLKAVGLTLNPGEVVALVGRTGSGKTTIGRLLLRAYDGYRGSITIDGFPLSELDPRWVRRGIAVVRQDVQLFPGDVRFNLTLGADISEERLREALKLARATELVERLGGLSGPISHEGKNLSSGEAQLLALARTLARDAPVVLLDEATANVDSLTEAAIQAATEEILARKTVLVVAHRLSTVQHADRIAVLHEGRVVETGTHAELLAAGGRYKTLFEEQFLRAVAPT